MKALMIMEGKDWDRGEIEDLAQYHPNLTVKQLLGSRTYMVQGSNLIGYDMSTREYFEHINFCYFGDCPVTYITIKGRLVV